MADIDRPWSFVNGSIQPYQSKGVNSLELQAWQLLYGVEAHLFFF